MLPKIMRQRKLSTAVITFVSFLHSMDKLVLPQIPRQRKLSTTDITVVRFLPSMDKLVLPKIPRQHKLVYRRYHICKLSPQDGQAGASSLTKAT